MWCGLKDELPLKELMSSVAKIQYILVKPKVQGGAGKSCVQGQLLAARMIQRSFIFARLIKAKLERGIC